LSYKLDLNQKIKTDYLGRNPWLYALGALFATCAFSKFSS